MQAHLKSTQRPNDSDEDSLARLLGRAGVSYRLSASTEWERTLTRLGERKLPAESREDVQSAVEDLHVALGRMGIAEAHRGEEDSQGMRLDSVKRKRRKKMSKHKYKKRRKVSHDPLLHAQSGSLILP